MRIATYKVENLLNWVEAMNGDDPAKTLEVESRPVLRRFNETMLAEAPYPHAMLIDGNDERGFDVGLLSRRPLLDLRSRVDVLDATTGRPIFSRDCAQFEIDIPGTHHLWVLVNHFKSRGYGSKTSNDARRKRQAETVAAILRQFDLRKQYVVVAGDFNELPNSASLAPLLKLKGLRNAFEKLPNDADRWTHRDDAVPSKNDQIDTSLFRKGSGRTCARSGSSGGASGKARRRRARNIRLSRQ